MYANHPHEKKSVCRGRQTALGTVFSLALLVLALFAAPTLAQAQTPTLFGALSNFDVMNDTGGETHGFEIELDGLNPQDAYYFYTYNRYGQPTVVPFAGGVYVRYMSSWDASAQQFTAATPVATNFTATTGHQCVGVQPSGCEHFGVVTLRNPTATIYRWLVADPQNPGALMQYAGAPVAIPAPIWTVQPPAQPGEAPVVAAEIVAPEPPRPEQQAGDAQWVKVYKTELPREVGLDELMTDDPVVPQDPAQVEVAWDVIQDQPVHGNGNGNRTRKRNQGGLSNGSHSVIRRYEFFKYTGTYDPITHEVVCGDGGLCKTPQDGEVGDYIGAQMAAVNLEVPTINVSKGGSGAVSSADRLISCGNKCSAQVEAGTLMMLTASPASGNAFAGWGGDCNGTQLTCTVKVDRVATVTATFVPQFTLSIGRGGSGTVTGAPAGIDCGKTCSAKYAQGTTVALTATPAAGLRFINWTGACSGTSTTCNVKITKDTQVQAIFAK